MAMNIDEYRHLAPVQPRGADRMPELRAISQDAVRMEALTGNESFDWFLRYLEAAIKAETRNGEQFVEKMRAPFTPDDKMHELKTAVLLSDCRKATLLDLMMLPKFIVQQAEKARAQIRDRLTQLAPIFLKNKHMLGEDFSMLDVAIAPLLWRLDHYGIDLPKVAAPLLKYAERIFARPAYIEALTPSEKVMRR